MQIYYRKWRINKLGYLLKVIEEGPYDTYSILMNECVNDEPDDENKNNIIE